MKKTLQECKEIVAQKSGYKSWSELLLGYWSDAIETYTDIANKMFYSQIKDVSHNYVKLDCPYDFTSRCTMGSCDCKPINQTQ